MHTGVASSSELLNMTHEISNTLQFPIQAKTDHLGEFRETGPGLET